MVRYDIQPPATTVGPGRVFGHQKGEEHECQLGHEPLVVGDVELEAEQPVEYEEWDLILELEHVPLDHVH